MVVGESKQAMAAREAPGTREQLLAGRQLDLASEPSREGPCLARLTVPLGMGDALEIWDDRVVAAGHAFPFDDWFGVRLVPDPRAPLTVDPPLAVSLLTHDVYWATYTPRDEGDAVRVIAVIREACQRVGIEPMGINEVVDAPKLPAPEAEMPLEQPRTAVREERVFNAVESVLLAIVHLSVFFFPVALPALVWRILSRSGSGVAAQAKEAAEFQGVLYVIALPTLVYTTWLVARYGIHPAAVLGLLALGILLALAMAFSFAAARQALLGRAFSYRSFATTRSGLAV